MNSNSNQEIVKSEEKPNKITFNEIIRGKKIEKNTRKSFIHKTLSNPRYMYTVCACT